MREFWVVCRAARVEHGPPPRTTRAPDVLRIALLAASMAWVYLGLSPAITMEGILADGASHMLRNGSWTVPHLYGEIYSFKPPLGPWLVAASFSLFGKSLWSLRLPFALCGACAMVGTHLALQRREGPRTAAWCAIAAGSGYLWIQKLRIAEVDVLLAATVGLSILAACLTLSSARPRASYWLMTYGLLALGFMAKGVPALLFFGPGLLVAAALVRKPKALSAQPHVLGLSLGLLVPACTWALLAWSESGGRVFEQPLQEGLQRSTEWTLGRLLQSLLTPLTVVGLFVPWSLYLPAALRAQLRAEPGANPEQERAGFRAALSGFVLAGIAVMMLMPATHARYLLPLSLPVGVTVGLFLCARGEQGSRRLNRCEGVGLGLLCAIAGGAAIATGLGAFGVPLPAPARVLALTSGSACIGAAYLTSLRRSIGRAAVAGVLLTVSLALWSLVCFGIDLRRAQVRSYDRTAASFAQQVPEDASVWVDMDDDHSNLFFAMDRQVRRFEIAGSLPAPGSWLVLRDDQAAALAPGAAELVQRSVDGRIRLGLWKVPRAR